MTDVPPGMIEPPMSMAEALHVLNQAAAKSILGRREPSKSSKPYQATLRRQSRTIKRRKLQTAKAAPRVARLSGPSCSGLAY